MADDGSNQSSTNWPLPKFYFNVDFGNGTGTASFQEVSGLETEAQVIEYRHGDSGVFSSVKMPGIVKFGNVTLKRGVFKKDQGIFNWFSTMEINTIKRSTVAITLLDEVGNAKMVWTLTNAFPVKISGTDLKSDSSEVAIETIEIGYEGVTMKNI